MKWEYIILDTDNHDFNSLGEIGYELVAVDNGKAYFKRARGNKIKYETVEDGYVIYDTDGKKIDPWDLVRLLND